MPSSTALFSITHGFRSPCREGARFCLDQSSGDGAELEATGVAEPRPRFSAPYPEASCSEAGRQTCARHSNFDACSTQTVLDAKQGTCFARSAGGQFTTLLGRNNAANYNRSRAIPGVDTSCGAAFLGHQPSVPILRSAHCSHLTSWTSAQGLGGCVLAVALALARKLLLSLSACLLSSWWLLSSLPQWLPKAGSRVKRQAPCAPPWHAAVSAPVRRPAPRCFSLVRRLLTTVILCSLLNGASPLPSVTSFSPMNIQISSTTTITFIGEQFGGADFSPSAYAAGQLCTTTSWTKATSLLCVAGVSYLSSGAGREAWVKVVGDTVSRAFSFDAPAVSFTSSNQPWSASTSMTVSGLNFGGVFDFSATAMLMEVV